MARVVQDHYFRQAKRDGYVSRAAYKLIEIDDRKRVLKRGDRVLDLGAAPGSWLQVAAERVGSEGVLVGVDLIAIRLPSRPANVHVVEGDAREIPAEALLAPLRAGARARFDTILSDLSPSTTGDPSGDHHRSVRLCESVLDRAPDLLRPGGTLVAKVFEGEAYPDLLKRTRAAFGKVKGYKPQASRAISREIYVIAEGFAGGTRAPCD